MLAPKSVVEYPSEVAEEYDKIDNISLQLVR